MIHDPMTDFDAFVVKHSITGEEMGAAFAAWFSGTGWNGKYERSES